MPNEKPNLCCPLCDARMQTKDSRPSRMRNHPAVRRRRRCSNCGWAITTYEVPVEALIQIDAILSILIKARDVHSALGTLIADIGAMEIPGGSDDPPASEPDASLDPLPAGE